MGRTNRVRNIYQKEKREPLMASIKKGKLEDEVMMLKIMKMMKKKNVWDIWIV